MRTSALEKRVASYGEVKKWGEIFEKSKLIKIRRLWRGAHVKARGAAK